MPRIQEEEEEEGNIVIEEIGLVEGERQDIAVSVAKYGAKGAPTLRINRVVTDKGGARLKALGTLKTVAEVEGLAAILPKAAKALGKALAAKK